jgi:glycosyltransferase involved in cell wall biosynthesis
MLSPTPCLLSINNYFYPRGGAEVLFLEQNRMFEEIGWQVVPFSMRHDKNLPTPWSEYFPDEIEFGQDYSLASKLVRAPRVIYSLQARNKLRELLRQVKPRIAHVHNIYHHLSPSILSLLKEEGIPVVLTVHDLKLACPAYTMMRGDKPCDACRGGHFYQAAANRCIKGSLALSSLVMLESYVHRYLRLYDANVTRFVVPSRFMLETLVSWGWSRERFVYIPNFVDAERFKPDAPIGKRFVYCGRLDRLKGVATLITAAAKAKQPLTIAGSGPDEARLRALAAELNADVEFTGHLAKDALAQVIETARSLVLPSEVNENAPLTVLEAYAAGRPVIGSRIAGIPELIREGETGVLFPTGDADALADVLTHFATLGDERLAAMGAAGRQWVEQDFSARAYRARMLELYQSIEGGSR